MKADPFSQAAPTQNGSGPLMMMTYSITAQRRGTY